MTPKTLLFLLGGSPAAYPVCADEFIAAAGGRNARIAVLAQDHAGWEKYKIEITQPWIDRGASHFTPLTPQENGKLDQGRAASTLLAATGIFICGGNTPSYHRLFASEPMRSIIRSRYYAGVPVAGISAGALISLEICQLTAKETGEAELQLARGLGLASGFVIGVHFTERDALHEVLEVMSKTKTEVGFGIDEPACMRCENGSFTKTLGKSVYRIEMSDFETMRHQIVALD